MVTDKSNGPRSSCLKAGLPYPLGATPVEGGTNFAVYSEHAREVSLCLFDGPGGSGERRFPLPGHTGYVWHGFAAGVGAGQRYGFRVDGIYDPWAGDWFNPAKLLIDPYAATLEGAVKWNDAVYGYRRGGEPDLAVRDMQDSAANVPLSLVVDRSFDWGDDRQPQIPLPETVIYETHVKGLTALHPEIPPELRGTYAGLAQPAIIGHLQEVGITSVELLPVQSFVDEHFLVQEGLRNYWGYNSLGFFAPESRYSSSGDAGGQVAEFKSMVKELHRHGIEVILDVVYNHTAETGRDGPTLSLRGLDNRTYYRLDPQDLSQYQNYSGTGNTVNVEHPAVMRMVLDSLRHWALEYHVDGFRFDLAPALGREESRFNAHARFFAAVHEDPVLARVKLIAEPWDAGPGGYQLGQFPVGWSEWNDRFRDSTRSFWLGHHQPLGEFALRLTGSADLFDRPERGPYAGVNYVTCHDGFTLRDLVSYSRKHNEHNNELNQDGHNHNLSKNFGTEGQTEDPYIFKQRELARRNLFATVMLAHGMPMMLGGDELSHTQLGNNNAYPQDNSITWYDWELSPNSEQFLGFVKHVIRLRRHFSALRRPGFMHADGSNANVSREIAWRDANGRELSPHDWGRDAPRTLQLLLSAPDGAPEPSMVILMNAGARDWRFSVPSLSIAQVGSWSIELDTAEPDGRSTRTISLKTPILVRAESMILARGVLAPPATT